MHKCKVLVVISSLEYGGAERQVVELANHVDQERFVLHVCVLSDYVPLATSLRKSVSLHIPNKKNRFDVSVIFRLYILMGLRGSVWVNSE